MSARLLERAKFVSCQLSILPWRFTLLHDEVRRRKRREQVKPGEHLIRLVDAGREGLDYELTVLARDYVGN